jgi:predicted amidohydrolase YtcJ
MLALPGFVDGHMHLDKTLLGLPWRPHVPGGSVRERVAAEKAIYATVAARLDGGAGAQAGGPRVESWHHGHPHARRRRSI